MICEELNMDVWELIRLSNRYPRMNILQPGSSMIFEKVRHWEPRMSWRNANEGKVSVVEPNLQALPEILSDAQVSLKDLDETIAQAHILVVLVDHAQFKCEKPKFSPYQSLLDTRGIWSNSK